MLRLYHVAGASTSCFAYDGLNMIADYGGGNALQHRYVNTASPAQPMPACSTDDALQPCRVRPSRAR